MKKQKIIILLSCFFSLVSLILVTFPKTANATSGTQRHQSTTCNGPDSSWKCNNCIDGVSTCYDHTCYECLDPSIGG
jgi:hypothetical protein